MSVQLQEKKEVDSTCVSIAKEIFGRKFIDFKQVLYLLGIKDKTAIPVFWEKSVPFSEEVLKNTANTHFLIAGLPISILDMHGRFRDFHFIADTDPWYIKENFACEERVNFSWYLVSLGVIPNSTNKKYEEQENILTVGEEIPLACEIFYFVFIYYLANGIRLLESSYSYCREKALFSERRFHVGIFPPDRKLDVRHYLELESSEKIGVISMRKSFLP